MIKNGPVEQATEILRLDKWCFSEIGADLYGIYFVIKSQNEEALSPEDKIIYDRNHRNMMLARQNFQQSKENNQLCPNDENYVSDEKLNLDAQNFINMANQFSALKSQFGFQYLSWHDFYQQRVLKPQQEAAFNLNHSGSHI